MTKTRRGQGLKFAPPSVTKEEARALQALELYARTGERNHIPGSDDTRLALDWIINKACGTYEEPFTQGEPDTTTYLLGRRSVGLAIVKAITIRPELLSDD